jgi:hypothetical protein
MISILEAIPYKSAIVTKNLQAKWNKSNCMATSARFAQISGLLFGPPRQNSYRFVGALPDSFGGLQPRCFALQSLKANLGSLQTDSKLFRYVDRAGHFGGVFIVDQECGRKHFRLMFGRSVCSVPRQVSDARRSNNPKHRYAVVENRMRQLMRKRHSIAPYAHFGSVTNGTSTSDCNQAL